MAYERELELAQTVALEAGVAIRHHYEAGARGWEKRGGDPITLADLEADRIIRARLGQAFPADALLSEEGTNTGPRTPAGRVWIVDPLDGTHEFLARIPEFAVSIALVEAGDPVVGVVHNPVSGSSVQARRGGGSWRDGRPVRVSSCRELAQAILLASRSEHARNAYAPYAGWFRELRPVGSIAWKLACIASGAGDLTFSLAPKHIWDVCAGDLLVREAGGLYSDFAGNAPRYDAASPQLPAGMAAGPEPLLRAFMARVRSRDAGSAEPGWAPTRRTR